MCRCCCSWECMISRVSNSNPPASRQEHWLLTGFLVFLVLQGALWFELRHIRPNMAIVPELPAERTVKAFASSDSQLYFRLLAFRIQNAGDTFGRNTPLKDYDYKLLHRWFFLLDTLDVQSGFVPAVAGYYYGQTQHTEDVRYVVDYLDKHYDTNPQKNWWWLHHAIYLANYRLGDKQLALRLAYKLGTTPAEVPFWAREMPAFIHEQLGEKEEAFRVIEDILKSAKDIPPGELNYMQYFIQDRLGFLDEDLKRRTEEAKKNKAPAHEQ